MNYEDDWLADRCFVVVDLETTGFSPHKGAEIIEVAGVKLDGTQISDEFQQFVRPEGKIPPKITDLTGITSEHVRGAPPVDSVLEDFHQFCTVPYIIAHNVTFDRPFLEEYSTRELNYEFIDTLRMARTLLDLPSNALSALIEEFNLTRKNAHRALDDARATAELFVKFADRVQSRDQFYSCQLPASLAGDSPSGNNGKPETDSDEFTTHTILLAINDLSQSIGIKKLARILAGSNSKKIRKYRSNRCFGDLDHLTHNEIEQCITDCIEAGLISRQGDNYPVLSITSNGIDKLLDTEECT
ncbi:MAG: exonuclease domain-containing protein [bacterium]